MKKKLDARKYKWTQWNHDPHGPFAFLTGPSIEADHEVFFDEKTFDNHWNSVPQWDYARNGISGFSFYGEGSIHDYAAMKLKDGRILFCITSGSCFTDTFHSAERITARYYMLTEI